jgi:hypothetical protein
MAIIEIDGVATEVVELACDFMADRSVRKNGFTNRHETCLRSWASGLLGENGGTRC